MTIEEKARRYDEALDRARNLHKDAIDMDENIRAKQCEIIFPELTESEDENMKNWILDELRLSYKFADGDRDRCDELLKAISWLEKQGEEKPADKVEPKFNVGNTIIYIGERKELVADNKYTIKEISKNCYISTCGNKIPFSMQEYYTIVNDAKFKVGDWVTATDDEGNITTEKILNFYDDKVRLVDTNGIYSLWPQHELNYYHLWTIRDAKDGDVLATENFIFIFKNIDDDNGVHYYCQYEISKHEDDNQFDLALPQSLMGRVGNSISHYSPATKEQRDTLMKAMTDAGYEWYEWDAEKKELKKITKFKVGDWIINNDVYGDVPVKIKEIGNYLYLCERQDGVIIELNKDAVLKEFKHWDITDAVDGNVLSWDDSKCIALFKNIYDEDSFNSHGFVGHCTGAFESRLSYHDIEGVHPATKEQCDLLFAKMKGAGYEWDDVKKKLKEIKKTSKWTEEDERHYTTIIKALHSSGAITPIDMALAENWFKSLKKMMEEQQ